MDIQKYLDAKFVSSPKPKPKPNNVGDMDSLKNRFSVDIAKLGIYLEDMLDWSSSHQLSWADYSYP